MMCWWHGSDGAQVDGTGRLHVVGKHFTEHGAPVMLEPTHVPLPGTVLHIQAGIDATIAVVDE